MSRVGAALPDDPSAQLRAVAERLSTLPDPMLTPFQRGKSARSKSGKSIGLGLYIARQIVLAHRGSVDVRSTREDGTTFIVRLPRARPAESIKTSH